jgi:hypothetical protein
VINLYEEFCVRAVLFGVLHGGRTKMREVGRGSDPEGVKVEEVFH